MFDNIFFDFDGTLFNTAPGIYNSFDKVVEHYNMKDFDRSSYVRMIGPPLKESFATVINLPPEEIQNAIKVYRAYYSTEGMFQCTVYDGVIELIEKLRLAGKKIFVATSKPESFAIEILKKKEMLHLFDFVGGADQTEIGRIEKVDVVKYVLESQKLTDRKETCVLIGDRKYDVEGAHKAGIKCAGILWGFGNREEFESCRADYILQSPDDVYRMLTC